MACLLAVGPVEGTFTYVTARRQLLHLVDSGSGLRRHVQRSEKMKSDLSGVRKEESGQLATTVHVPTYLLTKDTIYNMSSENEWNRGVDAILASCPALNVSFLCFSRARC